MVRAHLVDYRVAAKDVDRSWQGLRQGLGGFSTCFVIQVTVRSQSGHSQVNGQVTVRSRILRAYCDFK